MDIQIFEGGTQTYAAMLASIAQARRKVCLETYVFHKGQVAQTFIDALNAAAHRGCNVQVILDDYGCNYSLAELDEAFTEGVVFRLYHPFRWTHSKTWNIRNHRKNLIVDEQTSFFGGIGISDDWSTSLAGEKAWEDLHFCWQNKHSLDIQSSFDALWDYTGSKHSERASRSLLSDVTHHSPLLRPPKDDSAVVFSQSQKKNVQHWYDLVKALIEDSREHIFICSPYFIPNSEMIELLKKTADRGVKIFIVLPTRSIDQALVGLAAQSVWPKLFHPNIFIHAFTNKMFHTKLFVSDQQDFIIGSNNFDYRSFFVNSELGVWIRNQSEFSNRIHKILQRYLQASKRIDKEYLSQRPCHEKVLSAVLSPLRKLG